MTAEEYFKTITCNDNRELTEERFIQGLQDFAKLKCKEQRGEVVNELLNHEIDWNTPIKINTQAFKRLILNAPEPEV